MSQSLETWQRLLSDDCASLLLAAAAVDGAAPNQVARLRRDWSAELVAAALELVRSRRRARAKFPAEIADRLVTDGVGLEQASGWVVAQHKAKRFHETPRVFDLCCGIGGDAMALATQTDVVAIDRDPLRTFMTSCNAGCAVRVEDVQTLQLPEGVSFHLDPARRDASGRRRHALEELEPGVELIRRLVSEQHPGAVKLGPGVDLLELPEAEHAEIEFISVNGELVQCVLWCGGLEREAGSRTATRLGATEESLSGRPTILPAWPGQELGEFLHVLDPAVERAGLAGRVADELEAAEAWPGVGLLTSTVPRSSPWATTFRVLEELPWRPREVTRRLRQLDAGDLEVRSRGVKLDAASVRRQLQGKGQTVLTVLVTRRGRRERALILERSPR